MRITNIIFIMYYFHKVIVNSIFTFHSNVFQIFCIIKIKIRTKDY